MTATRSAPSSPTTSSTATTRTTSRSAGATRSWPPGARRRSSGASGRDEPGIYDGSYRAVAIDGDVAVAVGQSTYTDGPDGPVAEVYDNCFLLRFDAEGRCREFTEWFVKRPLGADA